MEASVLRPVDIEEEMKKSYLDYAMSVIVSRALPDVRDGLKPVQRRILYAMDGLGMHHNSPYKKSARIVGEVLGKYHPHGDTSVYDAMVRMAQDFSLRYVLIDGQGNFGSIDNDPPAAMRYTEARLAEIAEEMLADIDKNTVDFVSNFDDSLKEPSILPARLPNLLVNGSSGIAVGMATNIPPHNLGEVCDAIAYLIDNPEATVDELMEFVKGPDFPTAAVIWGEEGIKSACATGRGRVVVRAKTREVDTKGGRRQIIITELPYQVNKAALVERIAELVKEKKIIGVAEVRDESDREGMRLVVDLRKGAQSLQVLNNLYKNTPMQSTFFINMVALVNGQPKVINLKEALTCYVDFRCEVITRRSQFELDKAKNRAHILEGFRIALDNLEQVIKVIRQSETVDSARTNLMTVFSLSQAQAQAVLDMPLRRLAHLEREKIAEEYASVVKDISYLEDLLANPRKVLFFIKQDVSQLKSKYGDKRRTLISEEEIIEFRREDLVPHQRVIVTLSSQGFIKRLPASTYRMQHRGGRGVMGMVTREGDAVKHILVADTHDNLLLFTDRGRVYCLKCYELPEDLSRTSKGISLVNLLPIDLKDKVTALLAVADFPSNEFLLMATKAGGIKKTSLDAFDSIRRSGLIAIRLKNNDELVSARRVTDSDEVILASQNGRAVKFKVGKLRTASRSSGGVRGIRLTDDRLVSMNTVFPDAYLLTVTEKGFGKLTSTNSYPAQHRGGKGIQAHRVSDKTGKIAAARIVSKGEGYLVMLSTAGNVECIPIEQVSAQSRKGRGVHIMALAEGDRVVSITVQNYLVS
ncbi:MAG TPA: DNA gyrase subunit A [Dehalococcoidia bacterium]|nr:DNA gyrase subunit A [Dehalococcoidia bacterium]